MSDIVAVVRAEREAHDREKRARELVAFSGDAAPVLTLAEHARELIGDELVTPFSRQRHQALLDRALARGDAAMAAVEPSRLWVCGETLLTCIPSPINPAGSAPGTSVYVTLADAVEALALVAKEERALRQAYEHTMREEELERAKRLDIEKAALVARIGQERRDALYESLPQGAIVELHIAATSTAKARTAAIERARLLCAVKLGAPTAVDSEIDEIACQLSEPFRFQARQQNELAKFERKRQEEAAQSKAVVLR